MARNLAELLPARFEDITLDDARGIIERISDPRETLFFERKSRINGESLAKACAAFANTMGGVLVVGVADDNDELVGSDAGAGEAQLWVKDLLRGLVIPMPPFRARRLELENGRGILLVLVEESTATPHVLARNGAIYVRNPGSSDPLPLTDQRRLVDLLARGREAEAAADKLAEELRHQSRLRDDEPAHLVQVGLAATGVTAAFEEVLFNRATPEALSLAHWGPLEHDHDYRRPVWRPDLVGVSRASKAPRNPFAPDVYEGALVHRAGGAIATYAPVDRDEQNREVIEIADVRVRFERQFEACRGTLAALGAHGRLRLVYVLNPGGRHVGFGEQYEPLDGSRVVLWTSFEEDEALVADRVFAEIRRTVGLGPAV